MKNSLIPITLCLMLAACAGKGISLETRQAEGARLIAAAGMTAQTFPSTPYPLYGAVRVTDKSLPLRVYIEGDGLAWLTRTLASPDPTPKNPVGLTLAAADASSNVAYIARPCQYIRPAGCKIVLWTSQRYSDAVIQSTQAALQSIKDREGITQIELVGYSGGGGVASLVADRDHDVVSLRTVAANLDTDFFTAHHKVSPMNGSINPAQGGGRYVPQVHFVGGQDDIVPASVARSYLAKRGLSEACAPVQTVAGMTHEGSWAGQWPGLVESPLPESGCNAASAGVRADNATE